MLRWISKSMQQKGMSITNKESSSQNDFFFFFLNKKKVITWADSRSRVLIAVLLCLATYFTHKQYEEHKNNPENINLIPTTKQSYQRLFKWEAAVSMDLTIKQTKWKLKEKYTI